MTRSRRRLWVVLGLAVIALALAAWFASSILGTYRQAERFRDAMTDARAIVSARDWAAAADRLPDWTAAAEDLAASTSAPPWRLLAVLPVVGPTASAAAELADAASTVLGAAGPVAPILEQVAAGGLRRPDGSVDLDLVRAAGPALAELADAVSPAATTLAAVDLTGVRSEVAEPLVTVRDALADAAGTLSSAAEAAEWAPGLLGADGPRRWLVLLQNPAEARGTGGFPGAFVVLEADDGRLSLLEAAKSTALSAMSIPTDGVPDDAVGMWGDFLTTGNTYNLTPHFPVVGRLSAHALAALGTPVDGVIAVDPAVLAAVLGVTGPVSADGITLSAQNAEQFFLRDAYVQIPDQIARNELTIALVRQALGSLIGSTPDPVALVEALRGPVEANRVHVWSERPDEQSWLESTTLAGVLPDTPGPVVTVAFNNGAGNKMDAFVAARVEYVVGTCPTAAQQRSKLRVTLTNNAPEGLPQEGGNYGRLDDPTAQEGSTRMLVHAYPPVGAQFASSTLDGAAVPAYLGAERGRPVWWTAVNLDRGQTWTWELDFTEPTVAGVPPRVIPQGMAVPEEVAVVEDATC